MDLRAKDGIQGKDAGAWSGPESDEAEALAEPREVEGSETDLLTACRRGWIFQARPLLKKYRANPSILSEASQIAVAEGRLGIVRLLHGMDHYVFSDRSLQLAIENDRVEVVAYFAEHGIPVLREDSAICAAERDAVNVMRYLHEQGVRLRRDKIFEAAIRNDSLDCFNYLIAQVGDFDLKQAEELACRHQSVAILHRLTAFDLGFARSELEKIRRNGKLEQLNGHHTKVISIPRYTVRTPSSHINLDQTTIPFLLYRRIARLFIRQ